MRRKILPVGLLLALLLTLPGCGRSDPETSATTPTTVDNPFDQEETVDEGGGYLSVGPVDPYVDEDGNGVAIQYTGGEITLDYSISGAGRGRNAGVMLFLDGMPQPYHTDTEEELAYMHFFSMPEDGDTIYFQLCFTPVTGKAGDTFHLSVCGVNNAQFKPDLITTQSYAGYHDTLEMLPYFEMQADPPPAELPPAVELLDNVTVTTEMRTESPSQEELAAEADPQTVIDSASTKLWYDNQLADARQTLDVTGQDTVHVTYRLLGGPAGGVYRVMFFADHQLMSDGKDRVWTVTVGRNEQVTIEADIRVDQLEENTTFYPLMAPTSELFTLLTKEQSILLYRTDWGEAEMP